MSDRLNIKHNSISFWRIVFTLLVVLIHCGYTLGGYIAVEFFFLVSGFLLAKSIFEKKQTIWEFITHRLKRLYPMYLFALIVYMLLMSAVGFLNDGYSARLFLVNFLENVAQQWKSFFMLQVFGLDTITVNFAAWYVAALFWVSVLYFIIAKILPRKAYLIFIAATSLALLIYFFFTTGHLDLGEGHRFFMCEGVPRAYFEMGIGILLYNLKAFLDDKKVTINCILEV